MRNVARCTTLSILIAGTVLTGCTQSGRTIKTVPTSTDSALVLSADTRAIIYGKNTKGEEMRCAEPQPDALRAIAQEFAAALKASGGGETSPELAAALSSAMRESAGGLGKRTPTIQLLRDFLFNACLASMNGVIRPGEDSFKILVPLPGGNAEYADYSFDNLTVDVIKQMDNLAIALHAVDGLTGLGNTGTLTLSAKGGSDPATAKPTEDGAAVSASTIEAMVEGGDAGGLSGDAAKHIAEALVKIVAIALQDQHAGKAFDQ